MLCNGAIAYRGLTLCAALGFLSLSFFFSSNLPAVNFDRTRNKYAHLFATEVSVHIIHQEVHQCTSSFEMLKQPKLLSDHMLQLPASTSFNVSSIFFIAVPLVFNQMVRLQCFVAGASQDLKKV